MSTPLAPRCRVVSVSNGREVDLSTGDIKEQISDQDLGQEEVMGRFYEKITETMDAMTVSILDKAKPELEKFIKQSALQLVGVKRGNSYHSQDDLRIDEKSPLGAIMQAKALEVVNNDFGSIIRQAMVDCFRIKANKQSLIKACRDTFYRVILDSMKESFKKEAEDIVNFVMKNLKETRLMLFERGVDVRDPTTLPSEFGRIIMDEFAKSAAGNYNPQISTSIPHAGEYGAGITLELPYAASVDIDNES